MAPLIARLASSVRNVAILLALASLAAAAAPVAWHLGGWSAALPELRATAAASLEGPVPPDLSPILKLAPFGAVAVPAEPVGPVGETTLDLTLVGVVLQAAPSASTAFIAHEGATQGYRPGDDVAGRAELIEVSAAQVVLKVEGELQTLSFPDRDGQADEPVAVEADATSGADRLRALVASRGQGGGASSSSAAPLSTQERIDLWRDRIKANPGEVLDAIGLIPTDNGYKIAEDHDSGVGLAGLRAGDVVRSVNGQVVGDVERDRGLFDEVAASGLARIEVQRGDRTLVMSFPLE